MPETDPPTPCWIRPDGSTLPAPAGLDAPIACAGDGPSGPDAALALGWIGARPLGGDGWWELLPPVAAPTVRAQKAAGALVRRRDAATPKPLAAALLELARCAWDSDRYADPEAALAARRAGLLGDRLYDAIEAALARGHGEALTPDMERIASAQDVLAHEVSDLYERAHAWRYGPSLVRPDHGRWSDDPGEMRAGAKTAADLIIARADRMREALMDSRLAVLGLRAADVAPPHPVEPVPGEPALAALLRIAREREAELDRLIADKARRGHLTDALVARARPAARIWADALTGTGSQVSSLRAYAETYLCSVDRIAPGDARRQSDLASHLISHECGRTSLELRHRIRRVMPAYLDRLRQALDAAPAEGVRP